MRPIGRELVVAAVLGFLLGILVASFGLPTWIAFAVFVIYIVGGTIIDLRSS